MNDLISVIIPVYKVEEYLCRCVDSVLAQTYGNLEIILVDDGSPDGCPAMCDAYAGQDARIRVIHQENAGLSGARNAGIDAARGQWLAFVDSDDYLAPDFLECLYRACVDTGSELSVCRWIYVRGEAVLELGTGAVETCTGREMLHRMYGPDGSCFVVAWNKLYRRELFQGIRYPAGRIHEDEATTYRIYDRVKKAAVVDSTRYGYFINADSITRSFSPRRLDWLRAVSERMDFFEQKGYVDLMEPGLRDLADGSIHIYFEMQDQRAATPEEQRWIRDLVRQGLKRVRRYGNFPLRTRIGYRLFLLCPGLYRKLLNQVMSESEKQ